MSIQPIQTDFNKIIYNYLFHREFSAFSRNDNGVRLTFFWKGRGGRALNDALRNWMFAEKTEELGIIE